MIAFTFVVTAFALTVLAVPLAYDVRTRIRNDERSELTKLAAVAAADISASSLLGSDPIELAAPGDDTTELGVYGPDGHRVAGTGPGLLDAALVSIQPGPVREITTDAQLIVAVPIASDEHLTAIVRAAEPQQVLREATRAAWARIALAAFAALATATVVSVLVAKRLLRPLRLVHERARNLGSGIADSDWTDSGLVEIDTIAHALQVSAERIDAGMTRERAFSADVSHQLRTPLTGLRLTIENELEHPRPDPNLTLLEALDNIDVLEAKIETMLELARDTMAQRPIIDLDALIRIHVATFRARALRLGRNLVIDTGTTTGEVHASTRAIGEILDVLIDNALAHGTGTITIAVRSRSNTVALSVTDQGPGIEETSGAFERRSPTSAGSGIGLALARRLAEAEGAQLLLTHHQGFSRFEVLLPATRH